MLLADQGQPLAHGEFFIDCEVKAPDGVADFIRLLEEDTREDRDAVPFHHAVEFRKQVNDKIRCQIPHCEVNEILVNCVHGAAECPDTVFAITLNVCIRDLHGNGINIAGENFFSSQQSSRDRQDSRTSADIENQLIRFNPPFQRLDHQLGCFVRSSAEGLAGIDSNWKPIMRNDGIFPTGNDKEIVAYRKACVGFLPFLGPITFLDNCCGNSGILPARTAEYGSNMTLNPFDVGPEPEIEYQASVSGMR